MIQDLLEAFTEDIAVTYLDGNGGLADDPSREVVEAADRLEEIISAGDINEVRQIAHGLLELVVPTT